MTKVNNDEILTKLKNTEKQILIEYMRELAIIAIEYINNKDIIDTEDYK